MPLSAYEQVRFSASIDRATEAMRRLGEALSNLAETPPARAYATLSKFSGMPFEDVIANPKKAHRRAKAYTHPDRTGSRYAWDRVEQAAKTLGLV